MCSAPATRRPRWPAYEQLRRAGQPASRELSRAEWPATSRGIHERFVAGYNQRDWDALRELFAPDVRYVDRRLVGWGSLEGPDAYLKLLQGGVELARDGRLVGEPLALGLRAGVARYKGRGHLEAGGGEFELEYVSLSLVENGLVTYVEIFDGADTGAALERFEEIGAQSEPERLVARVCRLVDARDWGGLADCYADDYELVDRRALGWEPLSGPDAIVGMFRSWTEMAPDLAEPLRGARPRR